MAAPVEARDLTAADISGSFSGPGGRFNPVFFTQNVAPVLEAQRKSIKDSIRAHEGQQAHVFNCTRFQNVYVTSDLHADYRKFLDILSRTGLIRLPSDVNPFNDTIYDPRIITETTWNTENACLIILGDLVDGRRGENMTVNDPRGQFESLIHMFLFNLRRRAALSNSMVIFTIGNHDYHALFDIEKVPQNPYYPNGPKVSKDANVDHFWNNYVHKTAQAVYGSIENRYIALRYFYEVQPLFYISLVYPTQGSGRREMVGIHAGFHSPSGADITAAIDNVQKLANALDHKTELNTLPSGPRRALHVSGSKPEDGGVWTRFYENQAACALLETPAAPILTVVGHCPVIYHEPDVTKDRYGNPIPRIPGKLHSKTKDEDDRYAGCMGRKEERHGTDNTGCVVLSCNNRLAHVDVGMSKSFYPSNNPIYGGDFSQNADKEVLHLQHDPTLSVANRYYNIVERFNGFNPGRSHVMFREAAPAAPAAPAAAAAAEAAAANNGAPAAAEAAAANNGAPAAAGPANGAAAAAGPAPKNFNVLKHMYPELSGALNASKGGAKKRRITKRRKITRRRRTSRHRR